MISAAGQLLFEYYRQYIRLHRKQPHGERRGVVVEYMNRAQRPRNSYTAFFHSNLSWDPHQRRKSDLLSTGGTYRNEHSASCPRACLLDLWRLTAVVVATASATYGSLKYMLRHAPRVAPEPPPCIAPLSAFSTMCRAYRHPVQSRPCRSGQLAHLHACESTGAMERAASGDATKRA